MDARNLSSALGPSLFDITGLGGVVIILLSVSDWGGSVVGGLTGHDLPFWASSSSTKNGSASFSFTACRTEFREDNTKLGRRSVVL